jgi:hypothetical protein
MDKSCKEEIVKKTVTPEVLEANRENAKKSTGPRRTGAVKLNAVKTGLLSRSICFKGDEEEAAFRELARNLTEDHQPQSFTEVLLVEDLAVSAWKLRLVDQLILEQMNARSAVSAVVCEAYFEAARQREGSLAGSSETFEEIRNFTWECQQLVLTTGGSAAQEEPKQAFLSAEKKAGNGSLEVKLGNPTDTLLRYANAWRRDFFRALAALVALQGK